MIVNHSLHSHIYEWAKSVTLKNIFSANALVYFLQRLKELCRTVHAAENFGNRYFNRSINPERSISMVFAFSPYFTWIQQCLYRGDDPQFCIVQSVKIVTLNPWLMLFWSSMSDISSFQRILEYHWYPSQQKINLLSCDI